MRGDGAASAAFVGRSDALRILLEQWRRVCGGEPRLLLVEGPAGIGKTALVQRFLGAAGGPSVLRATGEELEANLPFGVVEQLGGAAGDPEIPAPDGGGDPLAVGARLVRLFGDAQASGPMVVLIDDAHWADTPSLQALVFAFRRLQTEQVLGLVATRDEPLSLPDGLRRLAASPQGLTLPLSGLGVEELVELAAALGFGTLPRRAAARLEAHTGGNPLYASAFLRELGPKALRDTAGPLAAPQVFAMTVLSRLSSCSPEAEALVTAAAVLGRRCRVAEAQDVAGLSDPLPALDEAVGAGLLLLPEAGADVIVFSHPLVRAAVYHDLRPARRCRLHSRAAELLEGAAALEHRAAAAVGADPGLAADLSARARQEAAAGAWAAAGAKLDAAARLEAHADRRKQRELEAAEMLLRGGEVAAADARAEHIAALPRTARRQAVLGHLALLRGRQADAERLLAEAWAEGEHTDVETAASAAAQLSQLLLAQARGDESITWAHRALDGGARDSFTRGLALSTLVGSLTITGRGREGLALVAGLPEGVTSLTPEEVEGVMARGVSRLWTGDFTGACTDLSTIVSLRSSWRPVRTRVISLSHLAVAEFLLGQWDASVAHADLGVSLAADTDYVWIFPLTHYAATMALAGRGEWAAADHHAAATRRAAEAIGDASGIGYAGTAAAWAAHCQGHHAAVLEALEPVLALPHRDGIDEPGVLGWHVLQVAALTALGRLDEARAALRPFAARAAGRGHRVAMANAARVEGNLEAAAGRHEQAVAAFESGLRQLEGTAAVWDRALLEQAFGETLRRAGERRRAAALLQSAGEIYAHLGAEPFVAQSDRELAACGLTPARRSGEQRWSLTPQELAVARLVVSGLSNREVARELVISVKTVEYHLGNAYTKLGVRSRTQLAGRLADEPSPRRNASREHPIG